MKKMMVNSIYDIQDGDILFKNTEMNDKGKGFFMRVVNQITSGWQNSKRKIKGKEGVEGMDHTEFLLWNGTILETHSSVNGPGVRTQSFINWLNVEDFPECLILRRPNRFDLDELTQIKKQIAIDRGLPYALKTAIKEGFTMGVNEKTPKQEELIERGIFCSESSLKNSLYKNWAHMWPDEVHDFLVSNGYYPVFKGESRTLLENK